jgi:hypothetical protein
MHGPTLVRMHQYTNMETDAHISGFADPRVPVIALPGIGTADKRHWRLLYSLGPRQYH